MLKGMMKHKRIARVDSQPPLLTPETFNHCFLSIQPLLMCFFEEEEPVIMTCATRIIR